MARPPWMQADFLHQGNKGNEESCHTARRVQLGPTTVSIPSCKISERPHPVPTAQAEHDYELDSTLINLVKLSRRLSTTDSTDFTDRNKFDPCHPRNPWSNFKYLWLGL